MSDGKLPLLKRALCGFKSPLGAIMDFLTGSARTCYCCTFWRGALYGTVFGAVIIFILDRII